MLWWCYVAVRCLLAKVSKERVMAIMMELGEKLTLRQFGTVFLEYAPKGADTFTDYLTFMEIMYALKLEAIKSKNVTAQLAKVGSSVLCCFGGGRETARVGPSSLLERAGEWEIRKATRIDRYGELVV